MLHQGPMLSETVPNRQAFEMGINFFCIGRLTSQSDAFTHQFELYSGQENQKRLETEPILGHSANIVIRLMRCVPTN
jgi:hypothetical protein